MWGCLDDIKCCVTSTTKKYVLNWPIVPNTVKIGTNLSKEEVLMLEEVRFQLQQREALSLRCMLSETVTLRIPKSHFLVLPNPITHSSSKFSKLVRQNQTSSMANHKNKWENIGLMDVYYVVRVNAVPYP